MFKSLLKESRVCHLQNLKKIFKYFLVNVANSINLKVRSKFKEIKENQNQF